MRRGKPRLHNTIRRKKLGKNIVEKIFETHKVYGEIKPDNAVGLKVDEVYTQDATGTMTWLQFEAIGIDRVKVPLAVSYVDHNMIQSNYMNPDDHAVFADSGCAIWRILLQARQWNKPPDKP